MSDSLGGSLLIAAPGMLDPNFVRTVVLVFEHNDRGALGLILNRPTDAPVVEYLPGWLDTVVGPKVVFQGGPVQREVAVGLGHRRAQDPRDGWTPLAGGTGLVDLSSDPPDAVGILRLRVFSGYAGWSPGQLESEVAEGGWFVVPSDPEDGFTSDPLALWSHVLKRQGGALAVYATYPPDPSLN